MVRPLKGELLLGGGGGRLGKGQRRKLNFQETKATDSKKSKVMDDGTLRPTDGYICEQKRRLPHLYESSMLLLIPKTRRGMKREITRFELNKRSVKKGETVFQSSFEFQSFPIFFLSKTKLETNQFVSISKGFLRKQT